MATSEGPSPMETTYEWEDVVNDSTRMRLSNRGQPSGFPRVFPPVMAGAVRRANRQDLARLKRILEGVDQGGGV